MADRCARTQHDCRHRSRGDVNDSTIIANRDRVAVTVNDCVFEIQERHPVGHPGQFSHRGRGRTWNRLHLSGANVSRPQP